MARHAADSSVYAAIADPTRRAILDCLRVGEQTAGELQAEAGGGLTQPAFSQHLGVLRRAGLVDVRSEGRQRVYLARPESLRDVAEWVGDWVAEYDNHWDGAFGRLREHLDRKHGAKPKRARKRGGAA